MILGRPTNLWLGLTGSFIAFLQVTIVSMFPGIDPVTVAQVLGALGLFLGAVISVVANQPPTVNEGDNVHVITPPDQENVTIQATVPQPESMRVPRT